MKRAMLAAAALLSFSTPAMADNWAFVSNSKGDDEWYFVETETMTATSIWVGIVSFDNAEEATAKLHISVRCASREAKVNHVLTYRRDGTIIDNEKKFGSWDPVPPGTHLANVLNAACNGLSEERLKASIVSLEEAFEIKDGMEGE